MRQLVQAIEKSSQIIPPYLNWLQNVAPGFSLNGDQCCLHHLTVNLECKYCGIHLFDVGNLDIGDQIPKHNRQSKHFIGYLAEWMLKRRYQSEIRVHHFFLDSAFYTCQITKISILHKPDEFYTTLLERCRGAKHRIALASLYLGTGPLETALVEAIDGCLTERGQELTVRILLDANRGSRGRQNSRTMLLPLLRSHPHCQVSLFHTPALRGILRFLLPPKYNELVGLQHMKLYLFDDSVIISGANLSQDYFTNRQDRYILISDCPLLADFYFGLIDRVCSVSLKLSSTDTLSSMSTNTHPYRSSRTTYDTEAKAQIWGYYINAVEQCKDKQNSDHDTWLFPLIELPPVSVHMDSKVTTRILESADAGSTLHLATGYFNLTDDYTCTILENSKAQYQFLIAHPSTNGFLNARGPAGGIPHAYTMIAAAFLEWARRIGQAHRITVSEYQRSGWTYHAKGLWHTLAGCNAPHLTLIGSSNFGARSVERDLESQIAIVTANENLSNRLLEEQKILYDRGTPFSEEIIEQPERKPPLWVKTMLWFFKSYF